MPGVKPIISAMLLLVAATGALHAQVTSGQDTSRTPYPVNRGPVTFPSDTVRAPGSATVATTDAGYIRQAISGSAMEVDLGRVAQRRTADDDVKDFARRMVTDHEAMGRQWYALAQSSRVTVQSGRDAATEQTVKRLEALSGSAFDRAYMTEMVRHHEQELARLQQIATSGRSPDVRRLATTGQTTVREHLTLAREVSRDVGGPAVGGNDDDRDRDRDAVQGGARGFTARVMSDHLLQVRLARRAEREAKNDETRRFAKRLADDFAWWSERWREVASRNNGNPENELDSQDRHKVQRLERASGQQVDRVYATIVADQLESLVAFLRDQRQADRSEAVQRVVDNELPVMREHLARARKLQGQVGSQQERNERD